MSTTPNLKVIDETANGQLSQPHSVEAEQALLGAIMYNNKAMDNLQGALLPEHFYVPFHAEIFETMDRIVNKGYEASPLTIRENLKHTSFADEVDLFSHLTTMLENAQYNQDVMALSEIIHTAYLQRQLMHIGTEMQREAAVSPDNESTQATLETASSELFTLAETGVAKTTVQNLKNPLQEVLDRAAYARANDGPSGVPSGFSDLDAMTGGLQNSDLIILAARPSMGKTALAVNLAYNVARNFQQNKHGAPVGMFSLEMSSDQLAARLLCSASNVNSINLTTGNLRDDEFGRIVAASNELSELPFYIDDTPALTIHAMRARARRMKRQYGIGLLIVDYLQLLRSRAKAMDNRVQEISEISMGLKAIARELAIPVIALSQLSRAVENRDNKRPQLSDLRESGSIEQDADIVMFLYREEYYIEKQLGLVEIHEGDEVIGDDAGGEEKKMHQLRERLSKVKGKTEVLVSKNRKGATGAVALQFQPETTTFHNYSPRNF